LRGLSNCSTAAHIDHDQRHRRLYDAFTNGLSFFDNPFQINELTRRIKTESFLNSPVQTVLPARTYSGSPGQTMHNGRNVRWPAYLPWAGCGEIGPSPDRSPTPAPQSPPRLRGVFLGDRNVRPTGNGATRQCPRSRVRVSRR